MKNKLKILLLDNNSERLRSAALLIHCCGDFCINPKSTISQYDYESNDYDVRIEKETAAFAGDFIHDMDLIIPIFTMAFGFSPKGEI